MQRSRKVVVATALALVVAAAVTAAAFAAGTSRQARAGNGLWGSTYSGKPSGATIKLGLVTDPGGRAGQLGPTAVQAWNMMVDLANSNGGIMGHPVQLLVRDEQLNPATGAQELRKLILSDKVNAAFGPLLSSTLIAESKVNGIYKTPLISGMAGDDRVVNNAYQGSWNPYMGMLSPTTQVEACAAAKYISKLPYTTFAVLKENYDYGIDNAREFEGCIKQYKPGVKIVKEVAANLGTKDFTSYINAMLAAKPQFIYTNVFGGDLVTFVKQYNQLGVKLPWATIWDLTALQAVGKNFTNGVDTYGYMRGPFFAAPAGYAAQFISEFQKRYKNYPSDWSFMAMETFIAYKAAVEKAGTYTDTDKVMNAYYNETFTGPFGPIKVRCVNGQGNVPEWVGKLAYNAKYGFATFAPGKWTEFHASDVWPTPDSALKIPGNGRCGK